MYSSATPPTSPGRSPAVVSPRPRNIFTKFASSLLGRKKSVSGDRHNKLTKHRDQHYVTSPTSTQSSHSALPTPGNSPLPNSVSYGSSPAIMKSDQGTNQANDERRTVRVRCRGVSLSIPFSRDTTVEDLLLGCAAEMLRQGHHIDLKTSILLESYANPSLERRLRRYEPISVVVESWDQDSQNMLILLPDAGDPEGELTLDYVSTNTPEPQGFCLPLYHSQRPGKWSQVYVSLAHNGQIFASKKPYAKRTDKDSVNLCHLTDYDLYFPTEAESRKYLKPPKRYCYAIKSLQKKVIFMNADNYMHLFSTDDPSIARQFRSLVHRWRSWYLAHRQLKLFGDEDQRPSSSHSVGYSSRAPSPSRAPHPNRSRSRSRSSSLAGGATKDLSIPPLPPISGTLLDFNVDNAFSSSGLLGDAYEQRKKEAQRQEARKWEVTSGPNPFSEGPTLLNSGILSNTRARPETSSNNPEGSWFPSAVEHSALQRTMTQNTGSLSRHPSRSGQQSPPLTRRPSTSSRSVAPSRVPSIRGGRTRDDQAPPLPTQQQGYYPPSSNGFRHHRRSNSQCSTYSQSNIANQNHRVPPLPQAPLIDLTPTFKEPPQWSRENKGHGVQAPQGMKLVDLATGPTNHYGPDPDRFGPPQAPIRRPSPESVRSGRGGAQQQMTLLQRYELSKQQEGFAGRARMNTFTAGNSDEGIVGGLVGNMMMRRNTVKGPVPGRNVDETLIEQIDRGRGTDRDFDKARYRMRSVDGRIGRERRAYY